VKKYKFLYIANRMLITFSAKEPCFPHFKGALHGIKIWIRIGSEVRSIRPPQSEPKNALNLTHHMRMSWGRILQWKRGISRGLWYHTEQVTRSIVLSVCKNVKVCNLNP